jgi:hypothetical protein
VNGEIAVEFASGGRDAEVVVVTQVSEDDQKFRRVAFEDRKILEADAFREARQDLERRSQELSRRSRRGIE